MYLSLKDFSSQLLFKCAVGCKKIDVTVNKKWFRHFLQCASELGLFFVISKKQTNLELTHFSRLHTELGR